MQNGIFKLTATDFIKGLITAIISAIILALGAIVSAPNFDVFNIDYSNLGHSIFNTSVIVFFSYLGKNFLSTNTGSVLNVTPNDTQELG